MSASGQLSYDAAGFPVVLDLARRDIDTESGNPWHEIDTGKFAMAPPGVKLLRGQDLMQRTSGETKQKIDARVREAGGVDAMAADLLPDGRLAVTLVKGETRVDTLYFEPKGGAEQGSGDEQGQPAERESTPAESPTPAELETRQRLSRLEVMVSQDESRRAEEQGAADEAAEEARLAMSPSLGGIDEVPSRLRGDRVLEAAPQMNGDQLQSVGVRLAGFGNKDRMATVMREHEGTSVAEMAMPSDTIEALESLRDIPQQETMAQRRNFEPNRESTAPAADGEAAREPMLFNQTELSEIPKFVADDKVWFQQKIDGIRGQLIIRPGEEPRFVNSSGKPLKSSTAALITDPLLNELPRGLGSAGGYVVDGELLNGKFHVFDFVPDGQEGLDFATRMRAAEQWTEILGNDRVVAVPTAKTAEEKQLLYDAVYANGGEGVMIKRHDSPYDWATGGRRVNHTLKAKFRSTAEVVVLEKNRGGTQNYVIGLHVNGVMTEVGSTSAIGKEHAEVGDVIEVAYLWAHPNTNALTQPSMVKVRRDKSPWEANAEKLRFVNKEVLDASVLGQSGDSGDTSSASDEGTIGEQQPGPQGEPGGLQITKIRYGHDYSVMRDGKSLGKVHHSPRIHGGYLAVKLDGSTVLDTDGIAAVFDTKEDAAAWLEHPDDAPQGEGWTHPDEDVDPGGQGEVRAGSFKAGEGDRGEGPEGEEGHMPPAPPLEMPKRVTQRWLEEMIPRLSESDYEQLQGALRSKGWTPEELALRVTPFREGPRPMDRAEGPEPAPLMERVLDGLESMRGYDPYEEPDEDWAPWDDDEEWTDPVEEAWKGLPDATPEADVEAALGSPVKLRVAGEDQIAEHLDRQVARQIWYQPSIGPALNERVRAGEDPASLSTEEYGGWGTSHTFREAYLAGRSSVKTWADVVRIAEQEAVPLQRDVQLVRGTHGKELPEVGQVIGGRGMVAMTSDEATADAFARSYAPPAASRFGTGDPLMGEMMAHEESELAKNMNKNVPEGEVPVLWSVSVPAGTRLWPLQNDLEEFVLPEGYALRVDSVEESENEARVTATVQELTPLAQDIDQAPLPSAWDDDFPDFGDVGETDYFTIIQRLHGQDVDTSSGYRSVDVTDLVSRRARLNLGVKRVQVSVDAENWFRSREGDDTEPWYHVDVEFDDGSHGSDQLEQDHDLAMVERVIYEQHHDLQQLKKPKLSSKWKKGDRVTSYDHGGQSGTVVDGIEDPGGWIAIRLDNGEVYRVSQSALGKGEPEEGGTSLELPKRITQAWLEKTIAGLSDEDFQKLLGHLRAKGWTKEELDTRVHPHRGEQGGDGEAGAAPGPPDPFPVGTWVVSNYPGLKGRGEVIERIDGMARYPMWRVRMEADGSLHVFSQSNLTVDTLQGEMPRTRTGEINPVLGRAAMERFVQNYDEADPQKALQAFGHDLYRAMGLNFDDTFWNGTFRFNPYIPRTVYAWADWSGNIEYGQLHLDRMNTMMRAIRMGTYTDYSPMKTIVHELMHQSLTREARLNLDYRHSGNASTVFIEEALTETLARQYTWELVKSMGQPSWADDYDWNQTRRNLIDQGSYPTEVKWANRTFNRMSARIEGFDKPQFTTRPIGEQAPSLNSDDSRREAARRIFAEVYRGMGSTDLRLQSMRAFADEYDFKFEGAEIPSEGRGRFPRRAGGLAQTVAWDDILEDESLLDELAGLGDWDSAWEREDEEIDVEAERAAADDMAGELGSGREVNDRLSEIDSGEGLGLDRTASNEVGIHADQDALDRLRNLTGMSADDLRTMFDSETLAEMGATIEVRPRARMKDGGLEVHATIYAGDERGVIQRTFQQDGSVYHDLFTLPTVLQGRGIAKSLLSSHIRAYEAAARTQVKTYASGGGKGEKKFNGGYTWAVTGFDFSHEDDEILSSRETARDEIRNGFYSARLKLNALFKELDGEERRRIMAQIDALDRDLDELEHSWDFALWRIRLPEEWLEELGLDWDSLGQEVREALESIYRGDGWDVGAKARMSEQSYGATLDLTPGTPSRERARKYLS